MRGSVGFAKIIKDAALERKVYGLDQMTRLFNRVAGLKGADLDAADAGSLSLAPFLTLLVNLAFYRENPRYTPPLAGAPKLTQETVPLLQCVKTLFNDTVPRMRTGNIAEFRMMLKADADVQSVLTARAAQLEEWGKKLAEKAAADSTDVYTEFLASLQASGTIGTRSIDVCDDIGVTSTYKSALSETQVRHSILLAQVRRPSSYLLPGSTAALAALLADIAATHTARPRLPRMPQDPLDIALGKVKYDPPVIAEAIARCADKKYATIMQMTNSGRLEGMIANMFNEMQEGDVMKAAVGSGYARPRTRAQVSTQIKSSSPACVLCVPRVPQPQGPRRRGVCR